jgi:hypothetical protein
MSAFDACDWLTMPWIAFRVFIFVSFASFVVTPFFVFVYAPEIFLRIILNRIEG